MGLVKGMRKVREAKEEMDSRGGDFGLRRLIMFDGERAVVRFWGDFENEEDPMISLRHYIGRLEKRERYQQCGENADEPCVFCWRREKGKDKGIGYASKVANFLVYDKRKFHVLEEEVRVLKDNVRLKPGEKPKPKQYRMTKYPSCSATKNRVCPYCKQGSDSQINGWRHWELSAMHADSAVAAHETARQFCRCGARDEEGNGTIVVSRYLCGHCQSEVEYYPEEGLPTVRCSECSKKLPPLEEIGCTECEDPERCSLQDFWVRVARSGGSTDTSYNFELIHPCRPPTDEELDEAESKYPNWSELLAPDPPDLQAATLGVANPFGAGGEEDEEHGHDEYPDDDIDYGEAEEPAPKKGFALPKRG